MLAGLEAALETLGLPGIFILTFLDSSFIPLPEVNDLFLFMKCVHAGWWAPAYAASATLGSLAGCSVMYQIGSKGGEGLVRAKFRGRIEPVRRAILRHGALAILVPALLPPPFPFKLFVVSAGVFGVPFKKFLWLLVIGRGLRYSVEAGAAVLIGDRAYWAIQEHPVLIVLGILAVLLFGLLLRYALNRLLKREGAVGAADGL